MGEKNEMVRIDAQGNIIHDDPKVMGQPIRRNVNRINQNAPDEVNFRRQQGENDVNFGWGNGQPSQHGSIIELANNKLLELGLPKRTISPTLTIPPISLFSGLLFMVLYGPQIGVLVAIVFFFLLKYKA